MNIFEKNRILKILITIDLSLLILYLISNQFLVGISGTISHWFDFDSESTIPAWFSSSQLSILFLLSLIYSTMVKDKLLSRFYLLLSFIFLFLSADEAASIHEGLSQISKKVSVNSPFPDAHGIWIFIYPTILLIISYIFRRSIFAFFNEKVGRTIFVIGAFVFVTGGVGFEIAGYYIVQNVTSESIPVVSDRFRTHVT